MKDRTYLVSYDNRLYSFPTDKTREMLDFAMAKVGAPLTPESRTKVSQILEHPEKWTNGHFRNSAGNVEQPNTLLTGTNENTVRIWLIHDGLEAVKAL